MSPAPRVDDAILPHGGALVTRWAGPEEARRIQDEAPRLPSVTLDPRQRSDLELLANGAYSPLEGFMGAADLDAVIRRARLASGLVWPIPIVLAVPEERAGILARGDRVALRGARGRLLGALDLVEKHRCDPEEYARHVFRTTDPAHPGVGRLYSEHRERRSWLLGGPVTVTRRPRAPEFPRYHLDPERTRALIREKGWRSIVGFQTRNPIHRAHEFLLKSALEIFDGLLLHPLVGETQPEDIPARVRLRCYEALIEQYYRKERVLLAVLPASMRFAGPREAVFHALIRKNYGSTHFIVGRDHAGVGTFYGPYDAQRVFGEFGPDEIGITPLFFENAFYCRACAAMASRKTCPHPPERHVTLSGSRVREMLARGEMPPAEFTRPEVARVLMELTEAT